MIFRILGFLKKVRTFKKFPSRDQQEIFSGLFFSENYQTAPSRISTRFLTESASVISAEMQLSIHQRFLQAFPQDIHYLQMFCQELPQMFQEFPHISCKNFVKNFLWNCSRNIFRNLLDNIPVQYSQDFQKELKKIFLIFFQDFVQEYF